MEPGDVVIILAEQTHKTFTRKGDHLIYNMQLTLSEALCGFDHVIKHLDGRTVVLSRPAGQVMPSVGWGGGGHFTGPTRNFLRDLKLADFIAHLHPIYISLILIG